MRLIALCLSLVVSSAPAQVTAERIGASKSEPGNWLTYSGNYEGHRYSPLDQVNLSNVAKLKLAWIYQVRRTDKFETTPIVVNGRMYITEPPSNVTALDTRTGRPIWQYRRTYPEDTRLCCGQVNRGVAVLGDLVYVGTVDGHLLALDAGTGQVRWDTLVADHRAGYSLTAAPLAVKDKIIMGMAGGEYGVRGFLDAYDAKTGKRVWRFWTIPGPGEPGNETWAGESWKMGAAATWVTGTYDAETNTLFWGTGNPGPDWNGDVRLGDNLYSDSVVAVDADTGKLKWYFQFTPHDVHDWDATEVPVLAEATVRGERKKLVLFANRNAFYYALDRATGKFLSGRAFARQTWAKGLDDSGRPMRAPGTFPTAEGVTVWPSVAGATNWFSPTYSPQTGLFYVAAKDGASVYFKGAADFQPGSQYNGGGFRNVTGPGASSGAIRALAPDTGELKWEFPLFSPPWSGLLSTAGGLVFGSTAEGDFLALDARTGKLAWRFQGGGPSYSNPMSYLSEGKQYVAVAIGSALLNFALPD
jgi:alcohol dehydrogenase (cytochrome c)